MLRSSGMLHGVGQQLVTDVSGQPSGTIFKNQAVQVLALLALWHVTSQKSEGLNYNVVEA